MSQDAGDWRPAASLETLRLRARLAACVRAFFAARGVLEVETPALSAAATPDLHLESFHTRYEGPGAPAGGTLYLATSPEYAHKRLLAAGSGPIFELARAFRNGEAGRRHNPEFTLLEWYRPGFDQHALMDEVEELLEETLGERLAGAPRERFTYREAFARHLGLDPHTTPASGLRDAARRAGIGEVAGLAADDRDAWLQLLLSHAVEPRFRGLTFLCDFPASQAALARVRRVRGVPAVAERFEVYVDDLELANGFHELADAAEQRRRFAADERARRARGLPVPPRDERFLRALGAGLPDCAGVALGFDRLVMLAAGKASLSEVLAFPIERA